MKLFIATLFLLIASKSFTQEEILALPLKHNSYITNFAFTSDRRYVYTVSDDKTIKLWYFNGALFIRTYYGHQDEITNILVNSSNTKFLSADKSKTLIFWDTYNGNIINQIKTEGIVSSLYLNERENILITGEDNGKLNFYQLPEMKKIKSISTNPFFVFKILGTNQPHIYFLGMKKLPNFNTNELTNKGNIQIYNSKHDTIINLSTYTDDLVSMNYVPDSSKIITASAENYMIRIWDALRLIEEASFKTTIKPATVFAAKNNKMIGIGSAENSEVKVYRNNGSEIFTIDIDTGNVVFGEFNKDITRLHILNNYGQFKVFDFQANVRHIYGYYATVNNKITATAYNSKTKQLFVGYNNSKTLIFNLKTSEIKLVPDSSLTKIELLACDTSNNYLIISYQPKFNSDADNPIQTNIQSELTIYNTSTNQVINKLSYQNKYITSVHANLSILYIGFNNGEIEIFDLQKDKKINSVLVAPFDIKKIISVNKNLFVQSFDNKIYILQVQENYNLKQIKTIPIKTDEILLDANSEFVLTNLQLISLNSNQKIAINALYAQLLTKERILILNENTLKLINNNEQIWNTAINFDNSKNILLDITSKFCIITNPFSKFSFYNIENGQFIGDLNLLDFNSWIFTTKINYDASQSIIPKIKLVKGIIYSRDIKSDELRTPELITKALNLNFP